MSHVRGRRQGLVASGSTVCRWGLVIGLAALMHGAMAQEAQIRRALAARLPEPMVIDEVTPTPIPGLYEVRSGARVFYTDQHGDYVIRGDILDTRRQVNLTQARIAKLSVIDFAQLPLQDAIVTRRGEGERKLAVFADPDCPYCKQLEDSLEGRDNVTIYTFLLPILGPASVDKAKAIWCADDRSAAWQDWMRRSKAPVAKAGCDAGALDRNVALASQLAIRGTPVLVFPDGTRVDGAVSAIQLERHLMQHHAARKTPGRPATP